ncbi:MAG: cyclic 2,3-diphosphoglycerate synthase [Candidatus Micrarchaeota archaeon]
MAGMRKVIIMGAAGRDFHNFNVFYRDNPNYEVVAITATQIPGIDDKTYPAELAGKRYPKGIPILPEHELPELIKRFGANEVVFAYSDVPFNYVMEKSTIVNAAGADFTLMGTGSTQIKSKKPVISVCAVRTGCGKSQTSGKVASILKKFGKKVAIIRHPMPYGDLVKQAVERFATYEDLKKYDCTIEEREEYEQHIEKGLIVYAGVDYGKILEAAEKEADVILWDGGNNDFSFYKPDLSIVVADPHRPGHELSYYPGAVNFRSADVIVINKMDTAAPENVKIIEENIKKYNPKAQVIYAASPTTISEPEAVRGKRVLVVEDGPTLTHGEMKIGAGWVAAKKYGAKEIIDAKKFAVGEILDTYRKYPHLQTILPAMGYSDRQIADLQETINRSDAEVVVVGTPMDLAKLLKVNKKCVRVSYEVLEQKGSLESVLQKFK